MTHELGSHPGATWERVDLQCHTPRDPSWVGSEILPGGSQQLDEARREWATGFVAAALNKGLSIVAVTDHHDTALLPYIIEAASANNGEPRLLVWPGIEVTCSDAVQCLAIFDPSTTKADWDRFIILLSNVRPTSDHASKTAPTEPCSLTLEDLFSRVKADPVLRESVILIPYFGRERDHKSLNAHGHAPRAKRLPFDGVYIECSFSELDEATLDKIQGRCEHWGANRRAILATGDNRRSDWARLGAHECWIRLGENSLEGLRQAFLADKARIAYSRPSQPSERILKVEIQSTLTGLHP